MMKAIDRIDTTVGVIKGAVLFGAWLWAWSPPPRYHFPMSVSFPSELNMVALGPTLETEDRKAPKREYRSM